MFLEITNFMYIGCKQCGIPYWAQYSKVPFYCTLACRWLYNQPKHVDKHKIKLH